MEYPSVPVKTADQREVREAEERDARGIVREAEEREAWEIREAEARDVDRLTACLESDESMEG